MNRSTWAKRAGIVVAVATLLLGMGTSAALGAPTKPQVPAGEKILRTDGTATVTVPNLGADSPKAWFQNHRAARAANTKSLDESCIYSDGYGWGPIGSESFYVDGQTCITMTSNIFSDTSHFANNHAYYYYLNFTTVHIVPSMSWWVGGINVSVGIPPSFGFSSTNGSDVIWAPGSIDDWNAGLHYDAPVNISATYIYNSYYTAQADFLVANQWYHVQGD